MKKSVHIIIALVGLSISIPILQSGCTNTTSLEPGGVYTDVVLAQTDQAIRTADGIMKSFVNWQTANAAVLGSDIAALAQNVSSHRKEWIAAAYAARDDYADLEQDYKAAIAKGTAGAIPPATTKINAALAVIANITTQITAYKSVHPNV